VTSRPEGTGVVHGPDAAAPPGAPGARQPAPARRHQDRRRSRTPTSPRAHRQPPPPTTAPPDAGIKQRQGVIVVTPLETLPEPLPAQLVAQLEASVAARPVIVDLGQITLVSAAPVMGMAAWLLGASHQPDRCCVVCPRPTARALLRKWHATRCIATFGSVGDALQARRFADDGYGTGWHPDGPTRSTPTLYAASRTTADNASDVCSAVPGNDSSP
jgi:hypothetical protein